MKVLLTVHQFFPEFMAGTEVLTLSVAKELLRRGHEVRVYTGYPSDKSLSDNERFDEYEFDGIHVYRFHHAYTPMAGQTSMIEIDYDNHLSAIHFEEILKRFEPDVVHFFHLNRLGSRLIEKASQFGVPAFMTLTDFWMICPTGQLLLPDEKLCLGPGYHAGNCVKHLTQSQKGLSGTVAKWTPVILVNLLTKLAALDLLPSHPALAEVKAINARPKKNISRLNGLKKILAPNQLICDVLVSNGVDPGLIVRSAYGIDATTSNSGPVPRAYRKPLQIGYIGTLARHKGCHILIEAFKALPGKNAVLRIYGNPADFPEYSNELNQLAEGFDNIEFCGTFPNYKISQVFTDLDLLVVPSIWHENTPLVIYSSQAENCPLVASNVRGISEVVIDEENGLLFEPGNATALTRQLLRLIEEPDLITRLGSNAKQPKSTSAYTEELLNIWQQ